MPEVFNGSMIPFSSKWAYIQPSPTKYFWDDLDAYVSYCNKNDITMEFHHLTGIRPPWVAEEGGSGGMTGLNFPKADASMQKIFNEHCTSVLDRYGDKIKFYQVVNEKFMMQYVPAAWKLLRQEVDDKHLNVKLGMSDCVNFWDGQSAVSGGATPAVRSSGETLETKGIDAIKWLVDQGIKPDFFSIHGHHPANLWADPRNV